MPNGLTIAKGPFSDLHRQMTDAFRTLAAEKFSLPANKVDVLPFAADLDGMESEGSAEHSEEETTIEVPAFSFTRYTRPTEALAREIKDWVHGVLSKCPDTIFDTILKLCSRQSLRFSNTQV
jgi:hypothetical protein